MDIELLSIVSTRDQYTRFKPYIQEHVLGKEARLVYNTLSMFYGSNPSTAKVDWTAFETYFNYSRAAQITPVNAESFRILFEKLRKHTPSPDTDEVLRMYITKDYTTRIVQAAQRVRDGSETLPTLVDLVHECERAIGRALDPKSLFVSGDSTDVLKIAASPGYQWQLNELNISMGPLRQGDFIIVAARPETGKTTFLAHQLGYMAMQITDTRPLIWVNNEEQSSKVNLRVKQAACGITIKDYMADPKKWDAEYTRLMNGDIDRVRILTNDAGCNNVDSLNAIFREFNPAIIIFDQLDKVEGFHNEDREDQRLTKMYNWARELAHMYGPTIAVCQADGTAENQRYIEMNQLANSKTGKPGEADAIITIGKVNDPGFTDKRFIYVPKNKLFGGAMTDPKERHGRWEVDIEPEIARYRGYK